MAKVKKPPLKKAEDTVKILGIRINSTSTGSVLKKIDKRIRAGQKTFIVTPNPEFLVSAKQNPWFRKILNSADISIPDGVGLLLVSRLLGKPLKERVSGADLAEKLLLKALENGWRVGIVGARRGNGEERQRMVRILEKKYPGAKIAALEDTPGWQKQKWEIIFACQGMGDQEKWADQNFPKINAKVIMGAGGSLDFLTGFAQRAPKMVRKLGLEWFWRLAREPWRWKRQLNLLEFIWLVLKEKFSSDSK